MSSTRAGRTLSISISETYGLPLPIRLAYSLNPPFFPFPLKTQEYETRPRPNQIGRGTPRGDAVEALQMSEKGILGRKAQAVREAEEGVFDNDNRWATTKGKGRKGPATTVNEEASVSKPVGKATRMGEDPPLGKGAKMTEVSSMKATPPKMSTEVSPTKAMAPKMSTEVSSMKAMAPKVTAEMPAMPSSMPAMPSSMPTESLDVSCWRKDNKASHDTDSYEPFHIPLLRCTRGG
jgi:hypothetical protein